MEHKSRKHEIMAAIRANTGALMQRAVIMVRNNISQSLRKRGSGKYGKASPAGQPPGARTGTLHRSLTTSVEQQANRVRGRVGTNLPYSRIQELGGTIKPIKAQWLTIPVTREGIKYGSARAAMDDGAVWINRKGKNPIIAKVTNKGLRLLFVCKKSVTLPARPYMRPGLQQSSKAIRQLFARNIASNLPK